MSLVSPRARDRDEGFTLIELLVVMIIIGILAAIAIPVFLNQRQRAVDASLKQDLRIVAQEAETFYVENLTYENFDQTQEFIDSLVLSPGNTVDVVASDGNGYCLRGHNPRASADSSAFAYWYDSEGGGLQTTPGARPTGGSC